MADYLKKTRFIELDILRVFAIILILLFHSTDYIDNISFLEPFAFLERDIGLGLFVFLSGYGLQYSILGKKFKIISFLKKRIIKIYPLYLFSLILYITLFHYYQIYHNWRFSPINKAIFAQLLSLQVILRPIFPQVYTLWFIGLIIPLYIIFALTARKSSFMFIQYNIAIFAFLLGIRIFFHIGDSRFFLYYPIFIIGALYARKKLISKLADFIKAKSKLVKITIYSLVLLFFCLLIYFNRQSFVSSLSFLMEFNISKDALNKTTIFLYTMLGINWLIVAIFSCVRLLDKKILPLTSFIQLLSNISYPVYLLHRVVYAIAYFWLLNTLHISSQLGTTLFPLVTAILFIISAGINHIEKSIRNRIIKY